MFGATVDLLFLMCRESLPQQLTMINSTLISPIDFVSMPWRNGAGTTTELLKRDLPDEYDGDGFAWRLSMAEVVEDGLFSNFEHYDRTLVLLEGNGITLKHDDNQTDVLSNPLELAKFNGESTTYATLHNGAIKDFNIMTRRSFCSAKTTCGGSSSGSGSATVEIAGSTATVLIFAVQGDVSVNAIAMAEHVGAEHIIPNQSLLILQPASDNKIDKISVSDGAFIIVEIF